MAPTKVALEQNEGKERALRLDTDKSTAELPRRTSFHIGGNADSDSSRESSNSPQHSAAPPVDVTPHVSFGEGADPVFKRVAIATHKYVYGLNSYKLLGRLHDLPEENEYVPREIHYSPVTPSHDSNATLDYTPPDFPRYTSEELRENERMEKRAEKSHEILSRYKGPHKLRSPGDQSSTQLHEELEYPRLISSSSQNRTKDNHHKARSSRVEKDAGHDRNITAGGILSQRAVPSKNPSPNRPPNDRNEA